MNKDNSISKVTSNLNAEKVAIVDSQNADPANLSPDRIAGIAEIENAFLKAYSDREKDAKADREQKLFFKEFFSIKVTAVSGSWLLFIWAVLILKGFGYNSFNLSDTVLITLITSTTATVFGLTYMVLSHFFPTSIDINTKHKFQNKTQ